MSLFRVFLALHIISVISWMAGILYLIRLFVYHAMENEVVVRKRFEVMEERAMRIIVTPAMIVSVFLGVAMIFLSPGLLDEGWFRLKLGLAFALIALSIRAGKYVGEFKENSVTKSDRYFRILNEIPTLVMIAIVFLVILRPSF